MLQLFDSQKVLWGAGAILATAVVAIVRPEMGWWSVPLAPALAVAAWAALRGLVEVAVRRLAPHWVQKHLASLIAGPRQPSLDISIWNDPISKRVAVSEFNRYWEGIDFALREELSLAKEIQDNSKEPLSTKVKSLAQRWSGDTSLSELDKAIQLTDPVHSSVHLPSNYTALLQHPLIQRLNEVRQLAFAFPVFPSGTHTRLAHSLGVAHLASEAMRSALDRRVVYTAKGTEETGFSAREAKRLIDLAAVSALVHDLGHPPLGHTLDRFFASRFPGGSEIADKRFLPQTLNRLRGPIEAIEGVSLEAVQEIVSEGEEGLDGWGPFTKALISSELDVDRLDYLQRDAHFTGQQEGLLNIRRLIQGIRPFQQNGDVFLTFDMSVLPDIEQFVYAREVMYLRCYEADEKVVSEWLILRAMNHLFDKHPELENEVDYFRLLSDAQLLELVEASESDPAKSFVKRAYQSDGQNFVQVASVRFEANALKGHLLGLHQDFTKRKSTVLERVEGFVTEIAAEAGIDTADVMLVLPDLRLSDDRKLGLDIWLLQKVQGGGGYSTLRLLSEKTDESASELLRRRKYVSVEDVVGAADLEQLKREAAQRGISLLHLLRRPRHQLRLFVHRRALGKAAAVQDALFELGVVEG